MFLLAVFGKEIFGESESFDFEYKKQKYHKLIDLDEKRLFNDIKLIPEFKIFPKTYHFDVDRNYLALFYVPSTEDLSVQTISHYKLKRKRYVFEQFLIKEDTGDFLFDTSKDQNTLETLQTDRNTLDLDPIEGNTLITDENIEELPFIDLEHRLNDLFKELKLFHSAEELHKDIISKIIKHEYLNPTLRQYQIDAVRWMIQRETISNFLPSEFIAVSPISEYIHLFPDEINDQQLFYNNRTLELLDYNPGPIKLPVGGILADEMGLGKTVEMLALILLNKRKKRKYQENEYDENDNIAPVFKKTEKVLCLCNKTKKIKNKNKNIRCQKCFKYQHKRCVLKYSKNFTESSKYICPNCWRYEKKVESSATIIVSPVAIKKQWENEIKKHITHPNFKVLIYDGVINSGWISPADMADYDVILTDYNVLKSEIYFTNPNDRIGLRTEKKYLNPVSPLPLINFWRVCLDEAQMVETPTNLCSKMVKTLSTVHRWSVTGTPISKKINDLYGLLYFLDCYPYTDFQEWMKLSAEFQQNNFKPLLDVLGKIMWRTNKIDVLEQINLPPQQEIVHFVTMSDIEIFFYYTQHEKYESVFQTKAMKIKSNLSMSKMDPHTLKVLMEPLRKIRQDCTAPSIFQRSLTNSSQINKKIVKPQELLKHLIAVNENDCKSELRMIISSINGLAGISIITKDYEKAAKNYKSVLKQAAAQNIPNVTVDTLQQIHALHNLIELYENNYINNEDDNDLPLYKNKYSELEWKYIDTFYSNVKLCEEQLNKTKSSIKLLKQKFETSGFDEWWRRILEDIRDTGLENQLIEKMHVDLLQTFQQEFNDEMRSVNGINYILYLWWTKLVTARKDNIKSFDKLDFFTKNIKPNKLISCEAQNKIDNLIRLALECHLNFDENDDDGDVKTILKKQKRKKKTTVTCEICKTKKIMMTYECIIFSKIFREGADTDGTWNPTIQERIIKVILNFAKMKKLGENIIKEGEMFIELLDLYKKEYKDYSKFWVEINYTASAYDELNMCHSRLRAFDPFLMTDEEKNNKLYISIYDVDEKAEEFQSEQILAENKYLKILSRIKYLKHLEENTEPEPCPICTKKPENKYFVLQCGHIMCYICFTQMKMYQKTHLTCCICRNKQNYNDVFCVTGKTINEKNVEVQGEYSTKVIEIVRTILELLKSEPNVKIIIFSQWETILNVIAFALNENSILYRTKSAKIERCIEQFKDPNLNVTCLLLPLQLGSKGLNLVEATHVILVEPILDPAEELQAIGRIHRIGQTKLTYVHKFIVEKSIEEKIYNTIINDKTGKWKNKNITINNLKELFVLESCE